MFSKRNNGKLTEDLKKAEMMHWCFRRLYKIKLKDS